MKTADVSSHSLSTSVAQTMSVYTVECSSCKKVFKTLYSLSKHARERHELDESDELAPLFKDQGGKLPNVPKPRDQLTQEMLHGYKMWIAGLVERMNSTFHPRLPGKYFEYCN